VLIWNYARCKLDATDRKEPTWSTFFNRKIGGSLKVSISFATISNFRWKYEQFSSVFGVISFLLNRIFGGEENVLGDMLHEGGLSGPKQSPQKYLTGFWYLTRLLVETKKLLTTGISNSVFISSSRWEAVIFPLERPRPMSGRIKINNAQCITVSVNKSLSVM